MSELIATTEARLEGFYWVILGRGRLPRAIEDGAKPPADLSDFDQPAFVVVIPFAHTEEAKAAA
jgi:hypothetical protein